jgi:23S rRNA pseudouridine955/2504/2580 synthase
MNDLSKAVSGARASLLEVGEESAAQRIDNFLLRHLKGVPKSHVYRVLRSGEVRVNSGRVKPDYRLKAGDRIRVPPVRIAERPKAAAAKPAEFPIVHEDPALLVVDKPAGVAVHGGSGVSFGVIESLRASRPEAKFLELAHRLDRDTSGLLMLAKKRSALVELHRMLRDGEVDKRYLAVARGRWEGRSREIREPLHKYVTASGERRVSVKEGGMAAVTRISLLKKSDRYSFLEIRLMTWRTHQIRVHLAHAGHPLLGDEKYGIAELDRKEGVKRLFLHAASLALAHPMTREALSFKAALPEDMRTFVERHFQ